MHASTTELWAAFRAALREVGARADLTLEPNGDRRWDAGGTIEGVEVVVEIKAVPTVGDVLALASRDPGGAYPILLARRISSDVASLLTAHDMGFFDGRGRLRLWRRPLFVDTVVATDPPLSSDRSAPRFDTPSQLDVALAVLDGTARLGVRATAARLARSPGTVSKQLAALRDVSLVDEVGEPTVPDLFEAVVEVWRPTRVALADRPREGLGRVNERLQIGIDDPSEPGWVLADAYAAAAWGAPIVITSASPPDFYVMDYRTLSRARSLLGSAEHGQHACTVAVAPAPFVCRNRYDLSNRVDSEFLFPSPIVAALDLAIDPSRGRETLEMWSRDLPAEVRRVW